MECYATPWQLWRESRLQCKKREKIPTNKLCELSLLFNKKEGVEEQFPEVVGLFHYEELWNHLDKRDLRDFRSTKIISNLNIGQREIFLSFSMTRQVCF